MVSDLNVGPTVAMSEQIVEVGSGGQGGRQRRAWSVVATEKSSSEDSLRECDQRWLKSHNIIHRTLTNGSDRGRCE